MFLILLACSGSSQESASGPPALALLSPKDGDTVCGSPLTVSTQVDNFQLEDVSSDADVGDDVGHIHLYLNGQEVSTAYAEDITVDDVTDGEKQLRAELALANHDSLDPYVGTAIYITVDNSLCGK